MSNDPRHLDATIDNLRRASDGVASVLAYITAARDRLATASEGDREAAARDVATCELRMRADAAVLAHHLAAITTPAGAIPT